MSTLYENRKQHCLITYKNFKTCRTSFTIHFNTFTVYRKSMLHMDRKVPGLIYGWPKRFGIQLICNRNLHAKDSC